MKKTFVVLFIIFTSVFLILYYGVLDEYIPVKAGSEVSQTDDGNILHEEYQEESSSQRERASKSSKEEESAYISAKVLKVVDGDTLLVSTDERPEGFKVRYIGINTPESVHPDESKNTKEGKIASDRNKEIIKDANNKVYLKYDVQECDKYGRDLCYVYIKENGKYKMVQDMLLKEGMCQIMTIQPNSKYAEHFYRLQKKARKAEKGFWGTDFYS